MPIKLQLTRSILLAAAFFVVWGTSMAESQLSLYSSVNLNDRRIISQNARKLDIIGNGKKSIRIYVSRDFEKAISNSSEILFPESNSLVIDGREFFLAIVNRPSSSQPAGYCGSGSESRLYALEIRGKSAFIVFEKLIQSCLKNIDLASDGVARVYRSVSWNVDPTGIRVRWMNDENGDEATSVFQYREGIFIESPINSVN